MTIVWRMGRRDYAWPALAAVTVLVVLNTIAAPSFIAPDNWVGVLATASPFIVMAMAQAAPVLSGNGGLDLSVGPLAGLVNAVIVAELVPNGFDGPVAVIGMSLVLGILSGLLNGFLVAVVRIQPIIATLGTFVAYQGLTLNVLPSPGGSVPDWLHRLSGNVGFVPGFLLLFGVIAVLWLALERTAFRRNLLAVGGDDRAAYTAGVNVTVIRMLAYVMSGILASVAGIVFTAVLATGDASVGTPYTLISVAAVALGGVSLGGGRGGLLAPPPAERSSSSSRICSLLLSYRSFICRLPMA